MWWRKALPFSNDADPTTGGGIAHNASSLSTPTPSRFARHLSPSEGERKGAKLAAGPSSPPSIGGEVASSKGEPEWGSTVTRTHRNWAKPLLAALLLLTLPAATFAASNKDPDWPCIQRKVPELSLGQIWNGPELPASASDWSKDERISDLVEEVAQRRIPTADAQKEIRDFATALPPDQRDGHMQMLVQGLFDHMNAERSQVISGIGRYARKQLELAARLRKEASELDALRNKPDADINEIAARTDVLAGETRIFEERVQSLTYVCEVPTLIEQRLYALAKTVAEVMKGK
jgi:hypothetical protein